MKSSNSENNISLDFFEQYFAALRPYKNEILDVRTNGLKNIAYSEKEINTGWKIFGCDVDLIVRYKNDRNYK